MKGKQIAILCMLLLIIQVSHTTPGRHNLHPRMGRITIHDVSYFSEVNEKSILTIKSNWSWEVVPIQISYLHLEKHSYKNSTFHAWVNYELIDCNYSIHTPWNTSLFFEGKGKLSFSYPFSSVIQTIPVPKGYGIPCLSVHHCSIKPPTIYLKCQEFNKFHQY